MAALKSLRPAVNALVRNPILAVLIGLFGVVQLPQFALQSSRPLVASIVSLGISGAMILVAPFFQGGILGLADEALTGRTSFDRFVSSGKANYVSLLVAYLAVFAVNLVIGFVAMVGVIFGGIGLFAGGGEPNLAVLGVLVVIGLLFALAYLLVSFFIQFYAHAIVLSETDLVEGFKRSVSLVRHNLVSVLGYTAILLVGSVVLGGVSGVASLLFTPQTTGLPLPDPSTAVLVVAAIVYVVSIAVLGGFYATYSVAFYRSIE
ncbi:hypothetical protein ACFQAS_04655 [Halopenitus salinus]|uniref:DUF7847 domain-containing protein n=1 Tax=Halopenitus salinus TaxID=1198295 RepID=A0ABD5V037_9EURY